MRPPIAVSTPPPSCRRGARVAQAAVVQGEAGRAPNGAGTSSSPRSKNRPASVPRRRSAAGAAGRFGRFSYTSENRLVRGHAGEQVAGVEGQPQRVRVLEVGEHVLARDGDGGLVQVGHRERPEVEDLHRAERVEAVAGPDDQQVGDVHAPPQRRERPEGDGQPRLPGGRLERVGVVGQPQPDRAPHPPPRQRRQVLRGVDERRRGGHGAPTVTHPPGRVGREVSPRAGLRAPVRGCRTPSSSRPRASAPRPRPRGRGG